MRWGLKSLWFSKTRKHVSWAYSGSVWAELRLWQGSRGLSSLRQRKLWECWRHKHRFRKENKYATFLSNKNRVLVKNKKNKNKNTQPGLELYGRGQSQPWLLFCVQNSSPDPLQHRWCAPGTFGLCGLLAYVRTGRPWLLYQTVLPEQQLLCPSKAAVTKHNLISQSSGSQESKFKVLSNPVLMKALFLVCLLTVSALGRERKLWCLSLLMKTLNLSLELHLQGFVET